MKGTKKKRTQCNKYDVSSHSVPPFFYDGIIQLWIALFLEFTENQIKMVCYLDIYLTFLWHNIKSFNR